MQGDFKNAGGWEHLRVWQESKACAVRIYQLKRGWPPEERYGLTSQICRSALSVPTNIVEGKARRTAAEFRNFLIIARGSLEETRSLLHFATEVGYLCSEENAQLQSRYIGIRLMLNQLIARLSNR
ncbi:four helix bundle protein [Nibricoccus sp. IMCC34717]|uniref:four helix bundle protein n=1 Tax=Nibricoccus sp. IMCC34717 TaxID=3034021 RepID=UPI00384E9BA2